MKTVLNVKVDPKVKSQAQKLAKGMGIPMSFLVGNFLRDFISKRQITFTAHQISKKLERQLMKIEKDTKNNKNISPVFSSAAEAIEYLHSL